jgi:hypothetical protein
MVNTTFAKGHHAQTRRTARNFFIFHTVAVHLINNYTLLIVTGEDDIAMFDSRRYSNIEYYSLHFQNHSIWPPARGGRWTTNPS